MNIQIGSIVSVSHPITCLNPDRHFEIVEIKFDLTEDLVYKVWVRGDKTCWFNANMITEATTRYEDGNVCFFVKEKQENNEYA